MGRKRKVPIAGDKKENAVESVQNSASNSLMLHGPMYTIMSNVQLNETFHKRYIKEMKQLYAKMDHDAFMFTFIKMIKSAMEADESNEYAHTTLLFCAKFVSSFDAEETHPLLIDTCKCLLTTISNNPHIRFRLCQFVNMILNALGQEAALDDAICDRILDYMLDRLRDISTNVRVQAILAMQRLQVPDNPDDPVLRAYQFHLCSDPSSRVRQAVITCMGRNYHTIPYILDRLWDIDEKVRRHTYLHMSSYPVRSYKVAQRLTLLQQGLNDRSDSVRKVVTNIMLQQWIQSYQNNLITLIAALKIDSNEGEIQQFRKIANQTLKEIFRRQKKDELIACLPLDEDGEFHRCVPCDKLNIEITFYWRCLSDYFQTQMSDELDLILPELSTFCSYVKQFCDSKKPDMDKFELMEFQYILLSLMEILYSYDLGDEIGRGNLQKLLSHLLKNFYLDQNVIEVIIRCAENLITDQNGRMQFLVEIVQDICDLNIKQNDLVHDRSLISELLANSSDAALNLKLSSLKVKILDLEEQEMNFVLKKDYVRAQQITEEKNITTEEYTNLLRPLLEKHAKSDSLLRPLHLNKVVKNETILKSLQIIFHMVVSVKVKSLNPAICKLYNEFICRHIASNQIAIREWALKCGTAYSMLYENLAKDVFDELYSQFFKNHNIRIWETAIICIFELLDRYGVDDFVVQEEQSKSKKTGRQLYNTLEFLDVEDESRNTSVGPGVGVIYMMSHFLDTCDDICIKSAIINGFCRLVLRGHIESTDIMEKLLLRYFNPTTDPEINQILSVFLENLIQRKKQTVLQPCLIPMISVVLSAPYDSPLHDIRADTITRFIIDATRQESCSKGGSIHNKLAITFLQEMLNNSSNKEECKLLAKDILTLELNLKQNEHIKHEMKDMIESLMKCDFDSKTIKNIKSFRDILDGVYSPPPRNIEDNDSENDLKSDDETAGVNNTIKGCEEETLQSNAEENADVDACLIRLNQSDIQTDISPSSRAPTMYGRDNIIGHRYLRKSLNMSQSLSDCEVGDGPSRPPKIRIEARIDSDKKISQSKASNKGINSRFKKNFRSSKKDTEIYSQGKDNIPQNDLNSQSTDSVHDNKSEYEIEKSRHSGQSKSIVIAKNNAEEIQSNELKKVHKSDTSKQIPIRVTRRNAAQITEAHSIITSHPSNVTERGALSEELNSSDIVPPSPSSASPRLATRQHRVNTRNVTTRSTNQKSDLQHAQQYQTSTDAENCQINAKIVSSTLISTQRNTRRKRVLQTSPKSSTTSDSSRTSPLRKQLRHNISRYVMQSLKKRDPCQISASGVVRKKTEKSQNLKDPHPFSIKENKISRYNKKPVATRQSTSKKLLTNTNDYQQTPNATITDGSENNRDSSAISTQKSISSSVSIRSGDSSSSLSYKLYKGLKTKAPSKIPIRTVVLRKASAGSTSSSSSNESVTGDKMNKPNCKLTSKMTRINICKTGSRPIPMEYLRLTRSKKFSASRQQQQPST